MDDTRKLTSQARRKLDSLVKDICNDRKRVALSHVSKPRGCAEHMIIPDAIYGRVSRLRPATKVFYVASIVDSDKRRYMTFTTDAFLEILIKTRTEEQNGKRRSRLVVPPSEDDQGSSIEGHEDVVIMVDLDPELSPNFALLMALLRQRADDVTVHIDSNWRMKIITISNENFDLRLEKLCLPWDMGLRHWCFPWDNTYKLHWSRHGTLADTSLKTLETLSSGRISVAEAGTGNTAIMILEHILKDDSDRVLIVCFEPWDRMKGFGYDEPAIEVETYMEEKEEWHIAGLIVKRKVEMLERTKLSQKKNGSKLVFVLFLENGSSNVMMRSIDGMSHWNTITILGTQQMSMFLDASLNHTVAVVPKLPCIEEQLDQLSWVRRCDTKGIVILTGEDTPMLCDNWGSFTMDDGVRKVLFPEPAFEKRLVKIENDKMAGFYCAVVALDAILDIDAPTVIRMIGLRDDARIATIKSLRYQGILNESYCTESEPMRLRLEPLAESESKSHMLFLRLLMAFEYDHKLALMVYNSLSGDQDTWVLTVLVACTLKLGLEELIRTEQILEVTQIDGGLETLLKMCTGPFRKLAKTGTLWLKLALVHKVVWVDGKLGMYFNSPSLPKFFKSIVHVGDQERPIHISSDACVRLDNLMNSIRKEARSVTGETPVPASHWYMLGTENTLRGVQRHMLEGHVLEIVLSRPRTTPSSVLGIRSRTTLEFRHEYMGDMAANIARDLPPKELDIFGIALSIPVLDTSTLYIDEWIAIPLQIVLSWRDLYHGKETPLFDGLIC